MSKTPLEEFLERTWAEYQSGNYNDFGKLNLVACIGEKGGAIIALLNDLREENARLAASVARWQETAASENAEAKQIKALAREFLDECEEWYSDNEAYNDLYRALSDAVSDD